LNELKNYQRRLISTYIDNNGCPWKLVDMFRTGSPWTLLEKAVRGQESYPVWMSDLPVDFWRDEDVLSFIASWKSLNNGKTSKGNGNHNDAK